MDATEFAERVNSLDESFKNAPADDRGNQLPEPGTYQAVFRLVDFFEKKDPPNNLFLKLEFEVVFDAEYKGWTIPFIYNLEPHKVTGGLQPTAEEIEQRLSFLKRDLKRLGVDVDAEDFTLAQVGPGAEIWDGLLDCTVEIAVVESKKLNPNTNKPYVNAYLNAKTGDRLPTDVPAPAVEAVVSPEADDDDDIPF